MADAQVVPILYYYTTAKLNTLLSKINRVFFTEISMPIEKNQWTNNVQ